MNAKHVSPNAASRAVSYGDSGMLCMYVERFFCVGLPVPTEGCISSPKDLLKYMIAHCLDVPSLIPGEFPDVRLGTNRQRYGKRRDTQIPLAIYVHPTPRYAPSAIPILRLHLALVAVCSSAPFPPAARPANRIPRPCVLLRAPAR